MIPQRTSFMNCSNPSSISSIGLKITAVVQSRCLLPEWSPWFVSPHFAGAWRTETLPQVRSWPRDAVRRDGAGHRRRRWARVLSRPCRGSWSVRAWPGDFVCGFLLHWHMLTGAQVPCNYFTVPNFARQLLRGSFLEYIHKIQIIFKFCKKIG
jgi:hypothetical protein